ncbi:MAG: tyrosine-type recombinase/integrase [Solirubrobacteraceae bacterium]
MSSLAPTLEAFFTSRLAQQDASANTVAAYRDALRMLIVFAAQRTGTPPERLEIDDLDAPMIAAFLDHLETVRHNTPRSRNARLAAIHSLFRFAALRHPEHAAVIQRVLSIPPKRADRALVSYLTEPEIAALLAAPDRNTWTGRRDHALLALAIQSGLRASELTGLNNNDVHLATSTHVNCRGKGRKQRITPLTSNVAAIMRVWQTERAGAPEDPLFPTRRGARLSRDALERRIAIHTRTATLTASTLAAKTVTAHVLRHSCAMRLLHAGVDITVIALWLGHESTETTRVYLHADLAIKERALARTAPASSPPGRYKPPDKTLAFLESL